MIWFPTFPSGRSSSRAERRFAALVLILCGFLPLQLAAVYSGPGVEHGVEHGAEHGAERGVEHEVAHEPAHEAHEAAHDAAERSAPEGYSHAHHDREAPAGSHGADDAVPAFEDAGPSFEDLRTNHGSTHDCSHCACPDAMIGCAPAFLSPAQGQAVPTEGSTPPIPAVTQPPLPLPHFSVFHPPRG